jgi:hypothetical protein
MGFVVFLQDRLLAARTPLVVLAVLALSNEMCSQIAHLNGLLALETDRQHGTGVEVVQIHIVFLDEPFIELLTESAD